MSQDIPKMLTLYQPSPNTLFQALALDRCIVPVCIDLDFTLLKSSSLQFFFPQAFLGIPKFLWTQRWHWSTFKVWVSKNYPLDPEQLPYRPFLVNFLKFCQKMEVPLVLATGAAYPTAEAIGTYLGCFNSIISSTDGLHCVGKYKAKALVNLYGQGNFHYFGDSTKDLFIWKNARRAVAVNPSEALSRTIHKVCVGKPCMFLYDGPR
ncbi:hypothetical protein [Holospora curviuscula]|uniref:Haloacid dehalogenase-like hydrolase n=1 Tax=Holospora curviuscula TaxID=1082868 RepID=A0A2S5R8E0_9PROT|nr:hypothetical protein [Holospora curviuscula]PPE03594.1 hypothetical protein HCUR_00949 [Holospora curviuscula]